MASATEAGLLFLFALVGVFREEWVWTQRPRAPGEGAATGNDTLRSLVFFYLSLDRGVKPGVVKTSEV